MKCFLVILSPTTEVKGYAQKFNTVAGVLFYDISKKVNYKLGN